MPAAGSGAVGVPARPVAGATATVPVTPNGTVTPSDLDSGVPDAPSQGTKPPSATRCADVTGTPSASAGSGYPGGRWTVPADAYTTVTQSDVRITMSDGVALVGDIAYPADLKTGRRVDGKFPVLLTQNPYGAAAFGAGYGELFVKHGYIFASVDVRGTGRSAGTHDMFSPREAEDGAALVAWAAKLEGSDGRVGLQGCSQLGINQLETATLLGPDSPVKAMIHA